MRLLLLAIPVVLSSVIYSQPALLPPPVREQFTMHVSSVASDGLEPEPIVVLADSPQEPPFIPVTVQDFLVAADAPLEWHADLLTIAECESHGNWNAVGDSGGSLGGYQLWSGWFREGEDPFDPLTNTQVAIRVRQIRGRFGGGGGWSCADLNGIY